MAESKTIPEDLGYLNIEKPPGLDLPPIDYPRNEGFKDKFMRKVMENPFVPLGLGVTTFALMYGIFQMKTGNTKMSQKMMRLRVGAQGFTVIALLAGVYYSGYKKKIARQSGS